MIEAQMHAIDASSAIAKIASAAASAAEEAVASAVGRDAIGVRSSLGLGPRLYVGDDGRDQVRGKEREIAER